MRHRGCCNSSEIKMIKKIKKCNEKKKCSNWVWARYSNVHRKAENDLSEGNQICLDVERNGLAFIKCLGFSVQFTSLKEKKNSVTFLIRIICHFAGSKTHRTTCNFNTPHRAEHAKQPSTFQFKCSRCQLLTCHSPERMEQAKHWKIFSQWTA